MSNTDNTDFFSLFSSDNQTSEILSTILDLGDLEGCGTDSLENFEDLFNTLGQVDSEEEDPSPIATLWSSPPARSPLIPPFLEQYQSLRQQVNDLTDALGQAQQQLEVTERRSLSCDDLIQQQADEISKNQEYLTHTVAEIQVYQQEAQRQQLQIETLAEQLASSQNLLAERERDCVRLQESYQNSSQQVLNLEKQTQELRARLQRQQRYTMQYKAALEQCLATPHLHLSSDLTTAIASFTGQAASIQPWSNQASEEPMTPLKSVLENVLEQDNKFDVTDSEPNPVEISEANNLEVPEPLTPISPESTQSKVIVTPTSLSEPIPPASDLDTEPSRPSPSHRDALSFAIQSQRVPRKSIDLPRFRRQAIPNA